MSSREIAIREKSFPAGPFPIGLAFDGQNIWAANQGNANTVTKLRASDGAFVGTFPVGVNPVGVTFDGTSIWVANQDSNHVNRNYRYFRSGIKAAVYRFRRDKSLGNEPRE